MCKQYHQQALHAHAGFNANINPVQCLQENQDQMGKAFRNDILP